MTNVLTAFSCQRTFVIFYLLNSDITGGVVHNYAFSCIHRHIGCRQRKCAWNLDDAHAVVVNAEPLLPYTVDLFCIEHFDFFNQFIQHPGCQLFCSGVLANQTDEHIRCHGTVALLFDFGAELFDFLGQLLLLVLISPGHSGKAFIRDFAGNIVLIDALKEAVQFFITGKECFQLFLFQLAVGFVRLLGVPDNSLQKVVLVEAGKLGEPPNLAQHHFFQKVYPDVVGGLAGATVALVVGAVSDAGFFSGALRLRQPSGSWCRDPSGPPADGLHHEHPAQRQPDHDRSGRAHFYRCGHRAECLLLPLS